MKLFLASLACQSLDLITPLLPDKPKNLRVAFVPTASETYTFAPWVTADRLKLQLMGFQVADVDLKNQSASGLRQVLSGFDLIHVTGGNTFYLLDCMRKSGFDKVLPSLLDHDVIYSGGSAGTCVMGPDLKAITSLDHPEEVPDLKDFTALGIVPVRVIPHKGRSKYHDRHDKIQAEWGDKVTFLTDNEAMVVNGLDRSIQSVRI